MQNSQFHLHELFTGFLPENQDKGVFYWQYKNEEMAYRELWQKVQKIIALIREKIPEKHKTVLLFLDSGLSFVSGLLAVLYSQNIPILVNNKLKQELQHLEKLSDYIITDNDNVKHLSQYCSESSLEKKLINIMPSAEFLIREISDCKIDQAVEIDETMLYLFTSGSTGQPKLIKKTYFNIHTEIKYLLQLLEVTSDNLFLPLVPSFHIYGLLFEVLLPLAACARIRLDIPFSPLSIIEDGLLKNANYLIGNPTIYLGMREFIRDFTHKDFSHIKYLVSSTMALDSEAVMDFKQKVNINILELYGSTETGGIAYRKYYNNKSWKFFPYVKWQITEPDQVLELKSPCLSEMEGSKPDWYNTRDVIKIADDFDILGRVNQIIKVGGNRVSALEVENIIRKVPVVIDAVVIGTKTPDLRGETMAAYIVCKTRDNDVNLTRVKEFCRQNLPEFKIPKIYRIVDSIPRGTNSKVLYKKLISSEQV